MTEKKDEKIEKNNSNEKSNDEITFYLWTSIGKEYEVKGRPNDTFKSILDKMIEKDEEFKNVKASLYKGSFIHIEKTLNENKIEADGGIVIVFGETPTPQDDNEIISIDPKEKEEEEIDLNLLLNFIDDTNNFKINQNLLYESYRLNKNAQVSEVPESPVFTSQKHNHGLVLLLSNSNWTCNQCGISNSEKIPKNYCSLCDYNICNKCIGEEKYYPLEEHYHEQTKLTSFKFPFHEHKLIYCRTSRQKDKLINWSCDKCDKVYTNNIWSFFCTYCDYDICLTCSKKYFSVDDLVTNIGIKIDNHEHPLVYMITNKNWICKLCSKSYDNMDPTYFCTKCEYNICMECMYKLSDEQKYPFFTDGERFDDEVKIVNLKCHEHPLMYCITSRTRIPTVWNCNICMENFSYQDWSFFCSICDYDICYECYLNSMDENK